MILISVFQDVINITPNSGVAKIAYNYFNYIKKNQNCIIIFGNRGNLNGSGIKDLGKLYFFIFRILSYANKLIPYYLVRYLQEIVHDIFLYFRINSECKILFTTNASLVLCSRKAKRYRIKIVLLAGNPNDNHIYNLLRLEKQKLKITSKDPFDFMPRMRRYNYFLTNINAIISINEYVFNTFQVGQLINKKQILIPTIFDANFEVFNIVKNTTSTFTIFYCAYTSTLKGLHILLDAFEILESEGLSIKLIIGGEIETGFYKKIICPKLKDNCNIEFLGNLNSSQIANQLKLANIFIVPSLTDSGPVTMIEAMFSKTPIICSDGVGHKWLISDGVEGFIYNKDSALDLKNKIIYAYNNAADLVVMGENARKKVDQTIRKKPRFYEKLNLFLKTFYEDSFSW